MMSSLHVGIGPDRRVIMAVVRCCVNVLVVNYVRVVMLHSTSTSVVAHHDMLIRGR